MDILIGLGTIFVTVVLALDSYVIVPEACYGHSSILGSRFLGRRMTEGFNLKLPLIERVRTFSRELHTDALGRGEGMSGAEKGIELAARAAARPPRGADDADAAAAWEIRQELASEGRLSITFKGSVQYRPSYRNLTTFYEMSFETIDNGLIDAIASELLNLTAVYSAEQIIEMKEAVTNMLDCILRLERAPHHPEADSGWSDAERSVEERLMAYQRHKRQVLRLLECCEGSSSRIERRYGIEIEVLAIGDLDFSPETKKAFELRRQTKAEMDAKVEVSERWDQIYNKYKDELGSDAAREHADLLTGLAQQKKITDVRGGAIPIVNDP